MATQWDISYSLAIWAWQAVRRNAANTAFEAFTPGSVVNMKVITWTRTGNSAAWAVTYAHGLGTTPRFVEVEMVGAAWSGNVTCRSSGTWDGTNNRCVWQDTAVGWGTWVGWGVDASNILKWYIDATHIVTAAVTAVDATNVTLTWTTESWFAPVASFTIKSYS